MLQKVSIKIELEGKEYTTEKRLAKDNELIIYYDRNNGHMVGKVKRAYPNQVFIGDGKTHVNTLDYEVLHEIK